MELTITLPAELEVQVQAAAARSGRALEDYVIDIVKTAILKPALDELLAPVRTQFAALAITEDEFDELIEAERQAIWREKHPKP